MSVLAVFLLSATLGAGTGSCVESYRTKNHSREHYHLPKVHDPSPETPKELSAEVKDLDDIIGKETYLIIDGKQYRFMYDNDGNPYVARWTHGK